MRSRYRLVVFDWEGTLGDTLGQLLDTIVVEAKRLNVGEVDLKLARQFLALGPVVTVNKLFEHCSPEVRVELVYAVQAALASRTMNIYLIPGAKELVEQLHEAGIKLAIATNRGQQSLQRALNLSGLESYFEVTRAAGQTPTKPHPQMLEEILDECGVSENESLMVGDSLNDMELAKALGVDAVGVDFYHQPDQARFLIDAGALHVFDDFTDLARFLNLPLQSGKKNK